MPVTTNQRQSYSIEAFRLQRRALQLSRWAYLNEQGAFEMRDAANALREAASLLEAVSLSVLRERPAYAHLRPVPPRAA